MASNVDHLERRIAQLQRYVDRIEAVALFLSEHPTLAPQCKVVPVPGGAGLEFEEKAFIRSMGKGTVVLRLERYSDQGETYATRTVCEDVSILPGRDLVPLLAGLGIVLD